MKFSIIVPCYNLEPWIRQCLDSVIAQSYKDWECIVIDDESTDNNGLILDEYARRDLRFKIIHQKNAGEGGARNAGLALAEGEWVFFLDGDDLMLPNALSRLAACISSDDHVIRFRYCEFEDGACPSTEKLASTIREQKIDVSKEINMRDFFTYVWQHIYRRSVICDIKFKRYKRGCDRVFLSEVLLERVSEVKVVDLLCYGYRKRAGSAMNTNPSLQVLRDEMDHRLDIMEMIDRSGKTMHYAGNQWLEKYFITQVYAVADSRVRKLLFADRQPRIARMRKLNGLSYPSRLILNMILILPFYWMDVTLCYLLPHLYSYTIRCFKNGRRVCIERSKSC